MFCGRRRHCAKRIKNHAVILNEVSPRAQAGAKRSEESLKVTRAEAVWWKHAPSRPRRLRPFLSAILHCAPVAGKRPDGATVEKHAVILNAGLGGFANQAVVKNR